MTSEEISAADANKTHRPENRKKTGWIVAGAAVALLACGYGGAAWALQDRVPTDAKVEGVEIGGLSRADAVSKLESAFSSQLSEDLTLAAGDNRVTFTPQEAGLGLDYEATLDGLTGFTLDPATLYQRAFGGTDIPLETFVDTAVLGNKITDMTANLNQKPVEGSISVSGGKVSYKEPIDGHEVDVPKTEEAVETQWRNREAFVQAVVSPVDPKTPGTAFEDARKDASQLLSGNITINAGDEKAVLTPAALAAATSFKVTDGKVTLSLDNTKVTNAVIAANSKLKSTARDASMSFRDGRPIVIPARTGRSLDNEGLNTKVLKASTSSERKTSVDFKVVRPEVTTAEVESWGLTKKIVEFSTPYPTYDATRTKNLVVGSKRVTGVIIQPGEVFSLEKVLGPITKRNGYFESGVVTDGFSSSAVGGGLSQISTQMFNIGFLGGMDDVTHRPHSRWFDRYPAGREATLWEGQIDMQWRNSTDRPVMVQSYVTDSHVVSVLWGTKKWDVKISSSGPYNYKDPKTVYNPAEKCVPETGGQRGFTIDTTRTRTSGSVTLPADKLSWTYQPWNEVICGEDPQKKKK